MDEQVVNFIHSQYPWASEQTARDLVAITGSVNYNNAINHLRSLGVKLENTEDITKNLSKNASKTVKTVVRTSTKIKDAIRNQQRDMDPLEATTELMKSGAEIGGEASGALLGIARKVPGLGKGMKLFGSATGATVTTATAVFGMSGSLISEQEKTMRAMIDFGLATADLQNYNTMRTQAALTGQSLMEQAQHIREASGMLINIEKDYFRGAYNMSNMLAAVEADSAQLGDFGYNVEELSARFVEEANIMYRKGELRTLDYQTQRRIYEGFIDSSEMAIALASITGQERSSILEKRREQLEDVNFRLAQRQNDQFVAEKYGQAALQNIEDVQAYLLTTASEVSPTLAPLLQDAFARGFSNIQYSDNAVNAAGDELASVISLLPAESQRVVFDIIKNSFTGQISSNEIPDAIARIAQEFEKAPIYKTTDAITTNFTQIQAESAISVMSVDNARTASFSKIVQQASPAAESADNIIDGMDDMRVAMRTTLDTITPGYAAGATAVSLFNDGISVVGGLFSELFPNLESFEDQVKRREEARRKREEMKGRNNPRRRNRTGPSGTGGNDTQTEIPGLNDSSSTIPMNFPNNRPPLPPINGNRPPNQAEQNMLTKAQLEAKERMGTITDEEAALLKDLRDREVEALRNRFNIPSDDVDSSTPADSEPETVLNGNASQAEFVDQQQSSLARVRTRPISPELGQVLANAAASLNIPGLQVVTTSGGQMSMADFQAATGNKRRTRGRSPTYYLNNQAVRKGTTRHDDGLAADLELHQDGQKLSINHPHFIRFFEAAFALGAKGGSAGYMGNYRAHIDVIGTDHGGTQTWSNPTSGFTQAQQTGFNMAAGATENEYQQRLEQLYPDQQASVLPQDSSSPAISTSTEDNTATEIAALEAEAAATASRIASKIESENLGETAIG